MSTDPLFSTKSEIRKGVQVVNPAFGDDNPAAERAEAIWQAAYAVREVLFRRYREVMDEPAEMLAPNDQTMLLLTAFCDRKHSLSRYASEELTQALHEFRAIVPLFPDEYLSKLSRKPINVSGKDARALLQAHKVAPGQTLSGTERELETQARALAAQAHVEFPDGGDIRSNVVELASTLDTAYSQGTPIEQIADGREACVFLSQSNQTIYKSIPFRMELIHVKPILDEGPVESSVDHGTYLADHNGGMPLFDRARLLAQVPGICRTELLAISADGRAILKQPYLGVTEPSEEQIAEWAVQQGHVHLGTQDTYGEMAEVDKNPLVGAAPQAGKFFVATDINPVNARLFNDQVVPFDPVIRELSGVEIASHPGIQAATAVISRVDAVPWKSIFEQLFVARR